MVGLLLAVLFLGLVAFWPPLRRIAMFFLAFGFIGYLALGDVLDPDPENATRDMALMFFGIPFAFLLLISIVQGMLARSRLALA